MGKTNLENMNLEKINWIKGIQSLGWIACYAVETDADGREMVTHGSVSYPLAIYRDNLETMDVSWHWHEEMELICVLDGEGLFAFRDQKMVLRKGQGLFINAGVLHGAWTTESNHCDICSIVFHPRLVAGSKESIYWLKYVEPLVCDQEMSGFVFSEGKEWQNECIESILMAWEATYNNIEGCELIVRNELSKLLFHLYGQIGKSIAKVSRKSIRNSERLKQMLQYIHRNYNEDIHIEDIAEAAAIGESECLRCFKETIGLSPNRYLKEYRIQKACELLGTSPDTIRQIAFASGFSDESYFVKTFREIKGITPANYRKEMQEKGNT